MASVKDICRRQGISPASWYQWKSESGGMGASELKRTKELEAELGQINCSCTPLRWDHSYRALLVNSGP